MPNSNNNQNSGSGLKTVATFGIGAIVGALAAGAAYYFSSEEEQPQRQSHQYYQSNHPVNTHTSASPPQNGTDEKDEKDGTVTMCEICFVGFSELKECGVQIVSTPCGHLYCRDCIINALTVKPECPHCRTEVSDTQLRRIYL